MWLVREPTNAYSDWSRSQRKSGLSSAGAAEYFMISMDGRFDFTVPLFMKPNRLVLTAQSFVKCLPDAQQNAKCYKCWKSACGHDSYPQMQALMNYHIMQRAHGGADTQPGLGWFGEGQSRGVEQLGETSCDVHSSQGADAVLAQDLDAYMLCSGALWGE